jgi:glycosyltransferase involved in cell wall biosynthesis
MIISNGIDYDAFSSIRRSENPRPPTVALIGRVVPIKDVKTYIRAAARLRTLVPNVRTLLIGPTEEDLDYFRECQDLVSQLDLDDTFEFTGRVNLEDYLGQIDVVVLTSISEAQPLVLLEAGAAGVPSVATDVGSCRDILYGRSDEEPPLGAGGLVIPLANPIATAEAVARLLQDPDLYQHCSSAIQNRSRKYYNKSTVDQMYCRLYEEHLARPDHHRAGEAVL